MDGPLFFFFPSHNTFKFVATSETKKKSHCYMNASWKNPYKKAIDFETYNERKGSKATLLDPQINIP